MWMMQKLRAWAHELTGYLIFLLFTATLGPFLFGYHLSELNAPQDVITCVKRSIRSTGASLPQCMPMNATQIGMVSSAFTAGGFIGAVAAGPLAARYGRLRPMRLTTFFAALGPIAEALAPNIGMLILGRFISGLGAGAIMVVVPQYIAEIAPPSEKGFFGAFSQIMTNVGIFTTQLAGYFLSHGQMWRVVLAISGLVAILQFGCLLFAVDSPKWQANNGQQRAARTNLQRIRGHGADLTEETKGWKEDAMAQEDDEQQALLGTRSQGSGADSSSKNQNRTLGTFEVFQDPNSRYATLAGMMVLSAQQFCGINAIIMYGVSLLSSLLSSNSALLSIFVSILNIISTTACAPLIDVLGRKRCLLSSLGGMSIASVLLAIGIRGSLPGLCIVAVLLFVGGFSFGLGPVPFLLSSELVGPEAVGAAQSWGLAANWIATFIIAQFFPIVNERLGKGNAFFLFAGLDVLFFGLVFFIVPETKGKKDADEVWGREPRRED